MNIHQLQIDLRPKPHAHALDMGFALLRANAAPTYGVWLALWLPCVALCYGLAVCFPDLVSLAFFLPWWLKPLLERAPLYVLSRGVFNDHVTWLQALRAWPRQLGGGWFRLLTWWRLCVPGRGLYQPIWQLEGARGQVAAERRQVIRARRTASAARTYGIVMAHLEIVLQLGFMALIGFFLNAENSGNPFAYFFDSDNQKSNTMLALSFMVYAIPGAIIGPIYSACCFTLYLNRRATLEAWDIEWVLRHISPPSGTTAPTRP